MKPIMKTIAKTLLRFAQSKTALLLVLAVTAACILPDIAHAADAQDTQKTVEQSIASLLSVVMQFMNALLWPFLIVIGDLMDTDLILGPGMEERLKGIWIPVRDLVNIGFVLVLLVVAFYNVLGLGGGEGDLAIKTALPKIVLGLVLVNFTFIGGKVVLDLVNVATTAAFALPELAAGDETPYDFSAIKDEFQRNVCYKDYDETTGIATSWVSTDEIPIHTQLFCTKADDGTYDELDGVLAAKYFTDLNANNIGLVMAVNMGGLSGLSVLKADAIDDFSDLAIGIMFAVVMYLVFATSYLVLGIVLLTRLIVLWIALALSPLAVLVYVVPQIKEWAGGGGDFAQKIIKHLLAPVIIGLTMSLGYIMIAAWDGLTGNAALDGGGFQVDQVISTEFLMNGIDDLPQFIIALASIIIVWTGVFAAANDTYASFATEAIKGFGERVRDAALKAPTLLPSIPIGVKDGQQQTASFAALSGIVDAGLRKIEYGGGAQAEMTELAKNSPAVAWMINDSDGGTRDPKANLQGMRDILSGANNGVLQGDKASELASSFARVFEEKYKGKDKDSIIGELARLQQTFRTSTNVDERKDALSKLKDIAAKSASDEGFKEMGTLHSTVSREIQGLREVTQAPTIGGTAPTGAATGPTAPVTQPGSRTTPPTLHRDLPPLQTSAAGIAANPATIATVEAQIASARTAIPATDTANTPTLDALDHFVAAEKAVALSQATPADAALKTAAQAAVTRAQGSATTATYTANDARLTALATLVA